MSQLVWLCLCNCDQIVASVNVLVPTVAAVFVACVPTVAVVIVFSCDPTVALIFVLVPTLAAVFVACVPTVAGVIVFSCDPTVSLEFVPEHQLLLLCSWSVSQLVLLGMCFPVTVVVVFVIAVAAGSGDEAGAEGGGDPDQGHRVRRQGDRLQERLWIQRALPH